MAIAIANMGATLGNTVKRPYRQSYPTRTGWDAVHEVVNGLVPSQFDFTLEEVGADLRSLNRIDRKMVTGDGMRYDSSQRG
jgi:hypothetical protein